MKRVVALVAFSTGAITMEEKSVYEIDDALAMDLIAQGLCEDAATYFGGGGSGGGVLVVHLGEGGVLDKTWGEIDAADVAVVALSGSEDGEKWHSREFVTSTATLNGNYFVSTVYDGGSSEYMALGPDEYPVRQP